jgi:hypothetical protein
LLGSGSANPSIARKWLTPVTLIYNPRSSVFLAEIIFFYPEDGSDMFLRNVGYISTDYTASHLRI